MENKPSNNKNKMKLKKGNPTSPGTPISQPFNFEHREHKTHDDVVGELTNNQPSPGVTDQSLLPPPCLGNTNIDEQLALSISNLRGDIIKSLRSDIRTELKDMASYLTETIKTQMNLVVPGVHCTLCRSKLEESSYVNQVVNETEPIEQTADVSIPQACTITEDSYVNIQDVEEGIYVTSITRNDDVSQRLSNVSNPTYDSSTEDDIIMSKVTPSDNAITDDNYKNVRKDSTKRPIPIPRTSTSGSEKNAFKSLGFNVSKLEPSVTYPKEVCSEESVSTFSEHNTSEGTQSKQIAGQSIYPKSPNKGLPRPVQRLKKAKVGQRARFDERECLAKALQSHVQEIVATVVFKDSELPDALTAGGVITEDESSAIRTIVYRKDQIRVLLSLIKGRDLNILKTFLKYLSEHCGSGDLINKIRSEFEENKKANITGKSCVYCKLNNQVNVKYVTDKLWSISAIDDGIYNESVMCTNPTGSQWGLWEQLIGCINNFNGDALTHKYVELCMTLEEKNHYTHLSEALKARIDTESDGKLRHTCGDTHIQFIQRYKHGSSFGTTTSVSPLSSAHSSVRIPSFSTSQEILQDEGVNTSPPSRIIEKGQRLSEKDIDMQTTIQENQDEEQHNKDTVSNIDKGNDRIDEPFYQTSGQRSCQRSNQGSRQRSDQGSRQRYDHGSRQMSDQGTSQKSEIAPPLPQKKKQQNFKKERTKAIEDDVLHSSDV